MRSLHDTKLCYFCVHFCFAIIFRQVKKVKSIHGFSVWCAHRHRISWHFGLVEHEPKVKLKWTFTGYIYWLQKHLLKGKWQFSMEKKFLICEYASHCPFIKVSVKFIALHYNAVNFRLIFGMAKNMHRKQNSSVRNEIKEDEHIFTRNFHWIGQNRPYFKHQFSFSIAAPEICGRLKPSKWNIYNMLLVLLFVASSSSSFGCFFVFLIYSISHISRMYVSESISWLRLLYGFFFLLRYFNPIFQETRNLLWENFAVLMCFFFSFSNENFFFLLFLLLICLVCLCYLLLHLYSKLNSFQLNHGKFNRTKSSSTKAEIE